MYFKLSAGLCVLWLLVWAYGVHLGAAIWQALAMAGFFFVLAAWHAVLERR